MACGMWHPFLQQKMDPLCKDICLNKASWGLEQQPEPEPLIFTDSFWEVSGGIIMAPWCSEA